MGSATVKRTQAAPTRDFVVYRRLEMEAERDALELLQKAWKKDGPLKLPVDPFAIAQMLGIKVYLDHGLPPEVSGMLQKQAGYEDPEILLNPRDSRNRQRFTCAHELGHYSKHVKEGADGSWEYVDKRDPLSSQGLSRDEIYANKFAAELLMPSFALKERGGESNVAALALDFGVSADAMRFRLDNLGIS